MEDEGRGEAVTVWSRKKGRSGDWILSFKKNPTNLKEDQHLKMRHLQLGEVYRVCQTVAALPLCSTELFLYPAHARRRQTDAKVHIARERVTDTDLRFTVNRGAGRTLLGLLTEAVGASGHNYLWEKWEESWARHGGSWGNCDCDSHILLSHWSTLGISSRIWCKCCTLYMDPSLSAAIAHFNPLGVHKDEKSARVTTFRFVVSSEKER